jgi:hypothetical protein
MREPTNPHWARVVGYGPFPLWVILKEGLCPSSGNIKRLMMMTPEIDCDQTAIGLPPVMSAVLLIALNNFDKTWGSRRNI